jgi:hypothetical protein
MSFLADAAAGSHKTRPAKTPPASQAGCAVIERKSGYTVL